MSFTSFYLSIKYIILFNRSHFFYKLSCIWIYLRENVFTKKRAKCRKILTHCCNCQHPAKRSSDSTELFWGKKEQKTVSKLQTSGWAKYCQQTVSIFNEIILFYMSWYDFEENKKNSDFFKCIDSFYNYLLTKRS